jgi:hypothetical protein
VRLLAGGASLVRGQPPPAMADSAEARRATKSAPPPCRLLPQKQV